MKLKLEKLAKVEWGGKGFESRNGNHYNIVFFIMFD